MTNTTTTPARFYVTVGPGDGSFLRFFYVIDRTTGRVVQTQNLREVADHVAAYKNAKAAGLVS